MATLKDVAKLANVDVSTVSRALSNTSYVHPETKKKIYAAVEQLSYKPNLLAKGLRQGKRHTLGVVVPSINLSLFGEIVQGIEIQARKMGYSIMICNTKDNPDAEEECLNRLRNGLVDGILIAATGQNSRLLRDIKIGGVSVIQLVRKQDKIFGSVVADYYACAYNAVKYLYKKGCRAIGLINGSKEIIPYKERYRGYRRAIKECECTEYVAKSSLPQGDYFTDGYKGVTQLLDETPKIDGIMVAVDMQGIGVLRALKERGISVPGQVKVISLTGHSIGAMLETTLTSMETPSREMGEQVTKMIIEDIEAPPENKPSLMHMVEDLFNGTLMTDSIAHVVGVILISGAVMLVAAIVLNPTQTIVKSPTELAEMLVPVMGSVARPIMGIALLGAGFSSLLGNTQRGVVLLNAGFDKPTSLEDKSIRIGALLVLAVSAVICFMFGGSPVQLIYIANLATAIATPVSGAFIVMMIWRKDTTGGLKAPTALRICMTICYIVCLFLTLTSLKSLLIK